MMTKKRFAPTNQPISKIGLCAIFLIWLMSFSACGQIPPLNDNYSNSITLTGTDITFTGTLAGATIEVGKEPVAPQFPTFPTFPTQSVWWNWTAPTDTVLTIQILTPSITAASLNSGIGNACDNGICIFTNGLKPPNQFQLSPLATLSDFPQMAPLAISVPVTGGSNYYIQLVGTSSSTNTMRLVATNTPIILTQPRSQTVYSNASALFYVLYSGHDQTNFICQWYLNGTNLPGETAPMLALNNIDSSMAGIYTVAISNSAGVTLSAPATLTVSQSNFPVSLTAIGTMADRFTFAVTGELGRFYVLQSSTNLTHWDSDTNFLLYPYDLHPHTSIFLETNSYQFLNASNNVPGKYFRVAPYFPDSLHAEVCINNLRQIRVAKLLWAQQWCNQGLYVSPGGAAQTSDLIPYLPHRALPVCPDDRDQTFPTSYTINTLETAPVCVVNTTNHVFLEPQ